VVAAGAKDAVSAEVDAAIALAGATGQGKGAECRSSPVVTALEALFALIRNHAPNRARVLDMGALPLVATKGVEFQSREAPKPANTLPIVAQQGTGGGGGGGGGATSERLPLRGGAKRLRTPLPRRDRRTAEKTDAMNAHAAHAQAAGSEASKGASGRGTTDPASADPAADPTGPASGDAVPHVVPLAPPDRRLRPAPWPVLLPPRDLRAEWGGSTALAKRVNECPLLTRCAPGSVCACVWGVLPWALLCACAPRRLHDLAPVSGGGRLACLLLTIEACVNLSRTGRGRSSWRRATRCTRSG